MEIILKQDVQNLGYADEIVKVKNGYARNYLIPQGYAILATEPAKKMLAETLKQRAFKAEKIRKEAEFMAGKIEGLSVKIFTKASEKGTIFGSVNNIAVANALKEQHGIEIDRKKIIIKELPFGSTTESLTNSIEKAVKAGKVKIASIQDFTSSEVNIELKLPRGVYTKDVVDSLYAFTECEQTIYCNLLVIKDNMPVQMTVTEAETAAETVITLAVILLV